MHEELEDIIRELNPSVPIGEIRDRILLSIETEATNDRTAIDSSKLLTEFIDWLKLNAPNYFCHQMSHTDADKFIKSRADL